jgi:hypothetical protein
MTEQSLDHPSTAQLAAFGRGVLNHDEMAEVERHLAVCQSCCQVLSTLPDDEFIGLLRTAQNRVQLDTSLHSADNPSGTPSQSLGLDDLDVASSFIPPGSHSSSKLGETLSAGGRDSSGTREVEAGPELPAALVDHPRYRIR